MPASSSRKRSAPCVPAAAAVGRSCSAVPTVCCCCCCSPSLAGVPPPPPSVFAAGAGAVEAAAPAAETSSAGGPLEEERWLVRRGASPVLPHTPQPGAGVKSEPSVGASPSPLCLCCCLPSVSPCSLPAPGHGGGKIREPPAAARSAASAAKGPESPLGNRIGQSRLRAEDELPGVSPSVPLRGAPPRIHSLLPLSPPCRCCCCDGGAP